MTKSNLILALSKSGASKWENLEIGVGGLLNKNAKNFGGTPLLSDEKHTKGE